MKTTLIAMGTRGDVQPFIALGLGLQAAGHAVQLIVPEAFHALVTRHGLKCIPIAVEVRHTQNGHTQTGRLPPHVMYRLAQKYLRLALDDIWEASKQTDALILSDWGRIPGIHIAEKLDIPALMGLSHPQQMRFLFRETGVFGGPLARIKSIARKQVLWHIALKQSINTWRQKRLGLPTTSFWGSEGQIRQRKIPLLFAHSPSVFSKPDHWPEQFHVTGYWFVERLPDWQPKSELLRFLAAGPPPIFIGFSSMSNRKIARLTTLVLDALSLSKQRAVLGLGWSDFGRLPALPNDVIAIDAVPHDWLFPQVAAAVHHGGAGTTAAAFRAGVPNVIIPFDLDQPFWAWRVNELGVGPAGIPPKQLTAERLARAIYASVHDTEIRTRAATLGEQIRNEDGVTQAVELFNHYVAHP
jgi:sterol 3beta-glucosyltransferase